MDKVKTKLEFGRAIPHIINITPSDNKGFIVKIGCGTLAFSNKDDMIEAFQEYLNNPKDTEKRYTDNADCSPDVTEAVREVGTPHTDDDARCDEPQCESSR